jgi:hypothetical protein
VEEPLTGKLAMMVYPTCVRKIHLEDGRVLDIFPKFGSGCINYNVVRLIPSMFILMTGRRATSCFSMTTE